MITSVTKYVSSKELYFGILRDCFYNRTIEKELIETRSELICNNVIYSSLKLY